MEISKEKFNEMLIDLSSKNWKVRNLLKDFGGFDNLELRIKKMIYEQLGVKIVESMHILE